MFHNSLYIAVRYLFSKKGSTAVTFITWLSALAMMTAVATMFIIISVFSGLEDLSREMISNLHSDLTLSTKSGKTLKDINYIEQILQKTDNVQHYSKVIEEKVLLSYGNNSEIAYLRAVDSAYTKINPIDKDIFFGNYPSFNFTNEVILEYTMDNRLKIPIGGDETALLYMPKSGKGLVRTEDDLFEKKNIFVSGIFNGKDQLNNYIIAPLELGQNLLNLPKTSAYKIAIKLKNNNKVEKTRAELIEKIGNNYILKSKKEENAAFWKMINMEKLMVFLIFSLVIFITTFNLSGAIIILQLDKKRQAKTLISLGLSLGKIRLIYFYTGVLIVILGIISGLIVGSILSYLQMEFGIFQAGGAFPFPVRIKFINYILVISLALFFGILVSWFSSKINKKHF